MTTIQQQLTLPEHLAGLRLDKALAELLPEYSRARLQTWIKEGAVTINNKPTRTRTLVQPGDAINLNATLPPDETWEPEAIPLDIIHQDEDIIIINKPANMVVHPAAGNFSGTLVNALLHHFPELAEIPRAGIVHRLDKDTTGLLAIARSITAHTSLVQQLQTRTMKREYRALVVGHVVAGNTIDAPLGRHPHQRTKMAVNKKGKPAITHYRVLEKLDQYTLLKVHLDTGRTHQIRVHMAHIHHPIVGDQTYNPRQLIVKGLTEEQRNALQQFPRQALHAYQLGLTHPTTQQSLSWIAPLPEDMTQLIDLLKDKNS